MAEEDENPFRLPSDDKIFRMREEDKKAKELERATNRNLKVWQKVKNDSTSRSGRLQDLVGKTKTVNLVEATGGTSAKSLKMVAPRRPEKENMTEFIAKKREMFLVQMSLDTKREEIRKLEEKAQMKEEALQRSEQMLEEDAMRFDAFLKENDKKAHDAIKKAEEETKRKQEKTQEIKKLTQQIQALTSEMSKHKESLEDCMRYKAFLDMLTPKEHFKAWEDERQALKDKLRQESYEAKKSEWEVLRKRLLDEHRKELDALKEQLKKERRTTRVDDADVMDKGPDIPPPPRLQDEVIELEDEEPPMYFTDPAQLMEIFASLEEQNLFLIQNSQETERSLEELRHSFKETKVSMDSRTESLQAQISELSIAIHEEEMKQRHLILSSTAQPNTASHGATQTLANTSEANKEKLLAQLNQKVRGVCEQCEIDVSSKPSTLFMLSALESKLELLLQDIETMPEDYVVKVEKEKEKRRRDKKREEQKLLQIKQQEERNQRAIERSMQAPKKRTGRQIMQRSRPLRKETTKVVDVGDDDNGDEAKYFS